MDQQEDAMTNEDSLRIIDSMIRSARNQVTENGHLYLLWGWVVLICSLGQYMLQYLVQSLNFGMIWLLTWAAVIYQIIYLRKKAKRKRVKTYTDHIIKYVWLVFVILMLLLVLQFGSVASSPDRANLPVLALYGMPTFLSGIILKFRPLVVGGIACWVLALASLAVPFQYYMLLVAAGVIAGWIIPGYLLKSKYNQINELP